MLVRRVVLVVGLVLLLALPLAGAQRPCHASIGT
jgi:hypothetical protein